VDWQGLQRQSGACHGDLARHAGSSGGGGITAARPVPVAEGDLSALIAGARSIADVEALVLQHHTQFRCVVSVQAGA
jgi:hypothetical protein